MMPPALLTLYGGMTRLLTPLAGPLLEARQRAGKEDAKRLDERRGIASEPRPPGPLIWLHGASIGEGLVLLPLVERFCARGYHALVTTGTMSSAQVVAARLPAGATHQYLPLDVPGFMNRFLDHWQPDMALLAESELWPNLIAATHARKIPLCLVNARMSQRSYQRWQRVPASALALLGDVDLCLAQTPDDAARFSHLGAPRVQMAGNLKYDVEPPPADRAMLADLSVRINARPIWIAASVHADEFETLLAAHFKLRSTMPSALCVIIPRDTRQGHALGEQAVALGLNYSLRSANDPVTRDTNLLIADTHGEMGLWYRLAGIVFMGKSLAGHGGGQNPVEAAKLGSAILHGPRVSNFTDAYRTLDEAGGAFCVADAAHLAKTLSDLFADAPGLRRMARTASSTVSELEGATERVMRAIEPYLMQHLMDAR